jgi:Uma2 family endonuclease
MVMQPPQQLGTLLDLEPGETVQLRNVDWAEFETILANMGDRRASRIAYFDAVLEIRMPLPKHEKAKVLIGDVVKILLEELDLDSESFGSSTFKRQTMTAGIEPDDCFYIENADRVIGKDRIDLSVDPPPDLAIEVDVMSSTGLEAYQALGVPELWRFEDGKLSINLLNNGLYGSSLTSAHFPQFDVIAQVEQVISRSQTLGRSQALKTFRQEIRAVIATLN